MRESREKHVYIFLYLNIPCIYNDIDNKFEVFNVTPSRKQIFVSNVTFLRIDLHLYEELKYCFIENICTKSKMCNEKYFITLQTN